MFELSVYSKWRLLVVVGVVYDNKLSSMNPTANISMTLRIYAGATYPTFMVENIMKGNPNPKLTLNLVL